MPRPTRRKRDPWATFDQAKRASKKYNKGMFLSIAILLGVLFVLDKTGLFDFDNIMDLFSGNSVSDTMEVHFIDVGQGDCELITVGDNAMLIDGGERENGANI
ncbi:MAG: hypothetical protein LBM93_07080 [Oscillospiraceae bacterium]|nr:hypothetical protein [Oscillospiraceae bacterium]